jgi:hypothetical protein
MLDDALLMSLLLLLVANGIVHCRWRLVRVGLVGVCLVLAVGLGAHRVLLLRPVLILFLLLLTALLAWPRSRPWVFFPVSCMIATVVLGIAFGLTVRQEFEYDRLRHLFPYESMLGRLPAPKESYRLEKTPKGTAERLVDLEEAVEFERGRRWKEWGTAVDRMARLRRLHEDRVWLFIRGPGFGAGRMLFVPSEETLRKGQRERRLIPQPGPFPLSDEPIDAASPARTAPADDKLFTLHVSGVADFVHPRGFGFLKDRRHVAGFQAHQFSEAPEPTERWRVQRLDLVGLLLHPQPVAYLCDHLPRMDELRQAPTRSLDAFETAGLESLRRGEDLHVVSTPGGLRMLGAIRSARQCVECHDGQRGHLLGAFSYTLRPRTR